MDLDKAEMTLVKIIQQKHFKEEFNLLEKGNLCSVRLRHLSLFLENGVIRVGGRLKYSQLNYNQKHPILLPKQDPFVNLLIDHCHYFNLHTGPNLVLSILRQKYWILSARNIIRKRIRSCNICFKYKPKPSFPPMADLPVARVNQSKAFLHTGIDYAGPFYITLSRSRGTRSQKAYVCLFICLATKAVHLELVSDLSSDKFLDAFKRFLSRRGSCQVLYSDCGTNFIGAKRALSEIYEFLQSSQYLESINRELSFRRIEWKMNPPYAPHFGGIWESNIKSMKTHLYKVIGLQILSYEELNTVLIQIEALLNSRPLGILSSDPNEPEIITPSHFLTMTPLQHLPVMPIDSQSINLVSRKQLLDQLIQSYWKRWHIEYIHTLQVRQKWNTAAKNITPGTIVLVLQENAPPLKWPLGVVEEVHPGKDGIIRVATIRTKTGSYKRPVIKLCPLPSQ